MRSHIPEDLNLKKQRFHYLNGDYQNVPLKLMTPASFKYFQPHKEAPRIINYEVLITFAQNNKVCFVALFTIFNLQIIVIKRTNKYRSHVIVTTLRRTKINLKRK
jgi:hypothetical protein